MAINQTSVQNQDDIILESAKIEYNTGSGYIDVGLADNVVVNFNNTPREVQPGNGDTPDVAKGSASQEATITADLWELSTQNLADLSGGLFNRTTTAGTPLVDEQDVYAPNETEGEGFYEFATQQYNGAVPTNISVSDDSPVTYVLNTDYYVVKVNNKWGVSFITGGTNYDSTATITVEYDVTPSVAEKVTVGGTSAQTSVSIRITNLVVREDVAYDVENKWTFYKCFLEGDLNTALKNKDEADAVARIPLNMKAHLDGDRSRGDQLYSFEKTQIAH